MDFLSSLSTSSIVLLTTAVIALSVAITMGAFSSKNHMPVDGRTVLLTGASEGLGRAAAIQLSAQGAHLVLVARNVGRLEETLTQVRAAARSPQTQRFRYISADVSEPGFADAVLAETIAWNNGAAPDIVWCVAGVSTPMLWADADPALDSIAASRHNMAVNYFGAAELSRAVLREWLAPGAASRPTAEPKHLVFTASVLAFFALVGYGPYTPSKWALRALADTLAMELRLYPANPVRVHVVYPGTITSPGLERENVTKPPVTLELEKDDPKQSPEEVAGRAIAGLQRGEASVSVGFLGSLMRWGVLGGGPRNSWVVDTVGSWFVPLIYVFVLWDMHGKIAAWVRTNGQPGRRATKA